MDESNERLPIVMNERGKIMDKNLSRNAINRLRNDFLVVYVSKFLDIFNKHRNRESRKTIYDNFLQSNKKILQLIAVKFFPKPSFVAFFKCRRCFMTLYRCHKCFPCETAYCFLKVFYDVLPSSSVLEFT